MAGYIGTSVWADYYTNLISNNLDTSLWNTQMNTSFFTISIPTDANYYTISCGNTVSSVKGACYKQDLSPNLGPGTENSYDIIYAQVKVRGRSTNGAGYPTLYEYSYKHSDSTYNYYTIGSALDGKNELEINDDNWHVIGGITTTYTSTSAYTIHSIGVGLSSSITSGDETDFKDLIVVNLTSIFGSGSEPTEKECNERFFVENGIIYYKNPTGFIGVNNYPSKIEQMYVGVEGVAKSVKRAYVGVYNTACIWYGLTDIERLFKDMTINNIVGTNASSTSRIYLSNVSYGSYKYYISIYNKNLTIWRVSIAADSSTLYGNNRFSTSTASGAYVNRTQGTIYLYKGSTLTHGTSTAPSNTTIYGGTLVEVSFPSFSDSQVKDIFSNATVTGLDGTSAGALTEVRTNNKTYPIIIVANSNRLDIRDGYTWDRLGNSTTNAAASVSGSYLTCGNVYGANIFGIA